MSGKLYTLITIISAHIIHVFAYLIPRSKNIWVCIGWHKSTEREIFADNSKYFFLYLQNEKPHVTSVWLAKDKKLATILKNKGYKSYYAHSLRGIYYAIRARYTIVDARISVCNWKFSSGSKIVQLWHGKGMKKSGNDSNYNSSHSYFKNPNYWVHYSSIIATSEKTGELISRAFSQPMSDIIITGQPRTDIFFNHINGAEIDENKKLKKYIFHAKANNINEIILYAPTFRADGSNPLDQLNESRLFSLNSFLKNSNKLFIIGLHPKFAFKKVRVTEKYSNIMYLDPGLDIYTCFKDIDVIITDYSNIYIDFLLLEKQSIFFTYDEAWYRKTTGLNEEFETLTPGPHVTNFKELLYSLDHEDEFIHKRRTVKSKLFLHQDGRSSERIYEALTIA